MATTLTTETLKVWIKEDVKINGEQQGAETRLNVSVKHISKSIISTNALLETTLASFATTPGPSTYVLADVRYIRISNLDSENYVKLNITGASSTNFTVRLDPLASYVAFFDPLTGAASYADITDNGTLTNLATITATANSAAVDLEVFVASA